MAIVPQTATWYKLVQFHISSAFSKFTTITMIVATINANDWRSAWVMPSGRVLFETDRYGTKKITHDVKTPWMTLSAKTFLLNNSLFCPGAYLIEQIDRFRCSNRFFHLQKRFLQWIFSADVLRKRNKSIAFVIRIESSFLLCRKFLKPWRVKRRRRRCTSPRRMDHRGSKKTENIPCRSIFTAYLSWKSREEGKPEMTKGKSEILIEEIT